jgi:hypothetical protein
MTAYQIARDRYATALRRFRRALRAVPNGGQAEILELTVAEVWREAMRQHLSDMERWTR